MYYKELVMVKTVLCLLATVFKGVAMTRRVWIINENGPTDH